MKKSVEQARRINILQLQKAARQAHSTVLTLEWVRGPISTTGMAVLADDRLVVLVDGRTYQTAIRRHEFRKGRYQSHIQCLACAKPCHSLFIENGTLQCRRCAGLIYDCQRGHAPDRAFLKIHKIIARLGGHPAQVIPERPARMWRTTYQRLVTQLIQAQRRYYDALLTKISGAPHSQ